MYVRYSPEWPGAYKLNRYRERKTMEFLKDLFTEPLSYEMFQKAVNEKGLKLAGILFYYKEKQGKLELFSCFVVLFYFCKLYFRRWAFFSHILSSMPFVESSLIMPSVTTEISSLVRVFSGCENIILTVIDFPFSSV